MSEKSALRYLEPLESRTRGVAVLDERVAEGLLRPLDLGRGEDAVGALGARRLGGLGDGRPEGEASGDVGLGVAVGVGQERGDLGVAGVGVEREGLLEEVGDGEPVVRRHDARGRM